MSTADPMPWTPDFESYPCDVALVRVEVANGHIQLYWEDGRSNKYDVFLLRENSPDDQTIHFQSREMLISPLAIPEDLQAVSAEVDENGALHVVWSSGEQSRYHPGWLRAHSWFDQEPNSPALPALVEPLYWQADSLPEPPSYSGPAVLASDGELLKWLESLARFGIARLRDLPNQDGLLEQLVNRIGPIRESNFGRQYVLEIKDEPDSNAFTSEPLLQHIDMPTRETPHGLQFLFCRANTTTGGEGVYVDGFRIAEAIREEQPEDFKALTEIPWVYKNRARQTDYRAEAPAIGLDQHGNLQEVRVTAWLRAPLKAELSVQQRAYRAIRTFTRYAQNPDYQMIFRYVAGDLLAFDNRRILHGRLGYDATGGERFIEGIYADRDDLYSKIRVLRRAVIGNKSDR